jgi:hypothetical protein
MDAMNRHQRKKTCPVEEEEEDEHKHTHHQQQNQPPSCPTRLFWKSHSVPAYQGRRARWKSGSDHCIVCFFFNNLYSLVLAHQLSLCERRCSLLEWCERWSWTLQISCGGNFSIYRQLPYGQYNLLCFIPAIAYVGCTHVRMCTLLV